MKKRATIPISMILALLLTLAGCGKQAPVGSTITDPPLASSSVIYSDNFLAPDVRLTEAQSENRDTAAWLTVSGTNIDSPVLQSEDNDYYLRRDSLGQYSVTGCYFADYECTLSSAGKLSTNTIIYGHTISGDNEQFFGQLHKFYDDPEFAAENTKIYLSLPDRMLEWNIVSVGIADAEEEALQISANLTSAELQQILTSAIDRSKYSYPVDLGSEKLLTLATCTGDDTTRLVIVAQLAK